LTNLVLIFIKPF